MTIISRGVEISIAGGVVEMVRVSSLDRFFFPFFLFFLLLCLICFMYTKPYAVPAMKRKKPISPITTAGFRSSWEKSNTPNQ